MAPKRTAPKRYQPASNASYQKAKERQTVNNQAYQSRSKVKPAKSSPQPVAVRNTQAARYATKKPKQTQQDVNRQFYQSGSNVKKAKQSSQQIATQNAQARRSTNSAAYAKKTKQWKGNTASAAAFQSNKKYNAKRFNLASNARPTKYTAVKFQQNRRIQGSQYWQGKNYWAFRNYRPVWHDRNWWHSHYNRVVFVYGGWYYWNAGWWYPAWGYAPNSYYAYDGPIYAYNSLPPDQVVANVQSALQADGYYQGEVDGLLGPLTREAIAGYQRDHGLYETAAIDQPTLESLGMS
ncbi:MAG: peptidoglycan-binding protein [Verrucomicrobia bacterium]|nr:peptidoglycan-binding protein [Verrucomicrobiota bacterium]